MLSANSLPVVVVGSGAADLAAASRLRQAGLRVKRLIEFKITKEQEK